MSRTESWIVKRKAEFNQLGEYARQLEKQNAFLVEQLADIAQGCTRTDAPADWSLVSKLQHKAGKALSHCISTLRVPPKPSMWW